MRVCFYTLGCKVNLNETGALEQLFRANGFTIAQEGEAADVFIVNSCTVTNFGDQKSRKWLRRKKRENPGAVTVLTGCYPQAFPEEAAQFMEADLVCGNGDRKAILENVQKLLDGHERIVAIAPHQRGEQFEELPVERFETHTRAFIKVEDGCNRQCAYCVIPRARGPVRSRDEASILAELRQLAASGYREVVLSAISLPSYGLDTGTNLVELVEHCAQVEGIQRIRLGSLDPDMLTPEFITRLAAVEKLCPQFHLSLQSGCTATLRRMRRVYTAEQYAQVVDQLRAAYGERPVSFTTDCICGFPGETQADFEESCEFLKKIGFLKVHVFPYSRRSGTPAYDFPEQVHEREKQERSRVMNGIAEEVRREVLAGWQSTLSLWQLAAASELLFVGDAGTTEASRPSRRYGVEWTNLYVLADWLAIDADLAWSHARFRDHDPLVGDYIPGAVSTTANIGITLDHLGPWFGSLRLRYFGPRPLIEDNTVRSASSALTNLRVGYRLAPRTQLALDVYNLFDRKVSDIDYYYASRLRSEAEAVARLLDAPNADRTTLGSNANETFSFVGSSIKVN